MSLNVIALKVVQFCRLFPNRMSNIPAVSRKASRKNLRILKSHCKMKKISGIWKNFKHVLKIKAGSHVRSSHLTLITLESFEVFQSSQTLPSPFRSSFSCIKAQFADEHCKRSVGHSTCFCGDQKAEGPFKVETIKASCDWRKTNAELCCVTYFRNVILVFLNMILRAFESFKMIFL